MGLVRELKVDKDLVLKAMNADKNAFSEIYYSCYKDLYKFALYTLGNAEDAADVVADTFVDMWKGIGKLRNPEAFMSWAFKILSVRCKKEISDIIMRRSEYSYEDFMESPVFDFGSTGEKLFENANLAVAFSKLESEERIIVILSVLYGYTHREISEIIGRPHGTVGSKLYRTFRKLRKQMEDK